MEKNTEDIIIDHVDNITFNKNTFPISNMHALDYTRQGLYELALLIRERENDINTSVGHYITYMAAMMGSDQNKIMNYFNWFSISIINYVRLVGFIDIVNQKQFAREDIVKKENHRLIKKHCKNYIEKVIPEIYLYRNKLSAHHSLTDPLVNDNIATLESSVINTIVYNRPYLETAGLKWNSKLSSDKKQVTTEIKPWKLTKVYDELTTRYWNDIKIPKLEESKIKLSEDVSFSIFCPMCKYPKHVIEICPKCGFKEKGQPLKKT